MTAIFTAPVIQKMGDKSLRKKSTRKAIAPEEKRSYLLASQAVFYKKHTELFRRWQTCWCLSSCLDTQVSREHPWPKSVGRDTS